MVRQYPDQLPRPFFNDILSRQQHIRTGDTNAARLLCEIARSTTRPGRGQFATSGRAESSRGSRSPRAMKSSRGDLRARPSGD